MSVSNKKINISTTGDVYSINYSMNLSDNKSLVCKYLNGNSNLIDKSVIKYIDNIIFKNGYTSINDLLDYNSKNIFSVIYNLFDEINELPENIFKNCNYLLNVSQIPNNYTKICKNAFSGCYNLNNVNLHESITELEDSVFDGCKMLHNININNITKLGKRTFAGTGITSISLNTNINTLPEYVFADCKKLKTFTFESSLNVNKGVFAGCTSLTSVTITDFNDGNNKLPDYIFAGCKNLDIANNVSFIEDITEIGEGSLMNCLSLITFNNNILSIDKYGFKDCVNLESINLEDCTNIGDYAFKNCKSLETVSLGSIDSMDNKSVFEDCINLKNVNDIYENINEIGDKYFKNCKSLSSFNFSNIEQIGKQSFYGCESYGLDENNQNQTNITLDLSNVTEIGDYAFANCSSITRIDFNDSVSLGEGVFMNCTSLKEVELPNSIDNFTNRLFDNCSSLESITFESEITDIINLSGLSNCYKIKYIDIPESEKYKVIDNKAIIDKSDDTIIYVVKDLTVLEIREEDGILNISDDAFNNSNISILNINEDATAPIINENTFANIANNNFHVLISRSDPNYSLYMNILGNNKIYYI